MKITSEIFGIALVLVIVVGVVRFLLERRRQKTVDATGTVIYATLVSTEPVRMFGKPQGDLMKVTLRIQAPGESEPREVSMRTRIDARSRLTAGAKVPVVLDPKDPKRIYPASQESAKRAVVTGSRVERRMMESQLRTPGRTGPQQPSGYMPPNMGGRRR